jgi:hypothetical protein
MSLTMKLQFLAGIPAALAIALWVPPAIAEPAVPQKTMDNSRSVQQSSYATPELAAKALYERVKSHKPGSIYTVLGPGSEQLLYTGDEIADRQMRDRFVSAYDSSLKIEPEGDNRAVLLLGAKESPFPFPLVKESKGWRFDASAGAEEIINRRIGENELFAIEFCLAYGDAQREYAEADRDGDKRREYAQKLLSSKGKRDGLYWPTRDGEPNSPLGLLAARAQSEGYAHKSGELAPFHGYYYRILTAQGKNAPGGAYDYMVNGRMIGGYALVAYPARWSASGVMTFICNHDGVVYQKNLGARTPDLATKITLFDPDTSWAKVK